MPAERALDVEAAADAGKFREAHANQIGRNIEIEGDGRGGGGVAHVVNSRRRLQMEDAEIVAVIGQAELARQAEQLDVADDQVGLAARCRR